MDSCLSVTQNTICQIKSMLSLYLTPEKEKHCAFLCYNQSTISGVFNPWPVGQIQPMMLYHLVCVTPLICCQISRPMGSPGPCLIDPRAKGPASLAPGLWCAILVWGPGRGGGSKLLGPNPNDQGGEGVIPGPRAHSWCTGLYLARRPAMACSCGLQGQNVDHWTIL